MKPQQRPVLNAESVSDDETSTDEVITSPEEKPKKRRGRPPKAKKSEEKDAGSETATDQETVEQKTSDDDKSQKKTAKKKPAIKKRTRKKPVTKALEHEDDVITSDIIESDDDDNDESNDNNAIDSDESDNEVEKTFADNATDNADEVSDDEEPDDEDVEDVGTEDALEEVPQRPRRRRRDYKIQEVIKRRQIILVQVVKEERGNKGAALTTYLSLAGRYCVLMPNTARGGGISRKITDTSDRRRLKDVAKSVEIPDGMGLIIRTAGANRTKIEIKRDFDYLLRLWENVRDLTLQSVAPCLVYEEGSLIKRSIRDLYSKEIDEVWVDGERGYREAKEFMKMLMPSHAKNVKLHNEKASDLCA